MNEQLPANIRPYNEIFDEWRHYLAEVHGENGFAHAHVDLYDEKYWLNVRRAFDEEQHKTAYDFTFGNLRNPNQKGERRVHGMDDGSLHLVLDAVCSHENPIYKQWRKKLFGPNGEVSDAKMQVSFSGSKYGLGVAKTVSEIRTGWDDADRKTIDSYAFTYQNLADKRIQNVKTVWGIDDHSLSLVLGSLLSFDNQLKEAREYEKSERGRDPKLHVDKLKRQFMYKGQSYLIDRREADRRETGDRRKNQIPVDVSKRRADSDRRETNNKNDRRSQEL